MIKKCIFKHILVGCAVPFVMLINAFMIPEPYSHPLIYLAMAPSKLMPFFENRELMYTLTEFAFGRMTPNFAPIQILILVIFWFLLSLALSVVTKHLISIRKES